MTPELDALLTELGAPSGAMTGSSRPGWDQPEQQQPSTTASSLPAAAAAALLPKALLVRLTAANAARDYTGALAAAHRYFDHVQVGRGFCMPWPLCHAMDPFRRVKEAWHKGPVPLPFLCSCMHSVQLMFGTA